MSLVLYAIVAYYAIYKIGGLDLAKTSTKRNLASATSAEDNLRPETVPASMEHIGYMDPIDLSHKDLHSNFSVGFEIVPMGWNTPKTEYDKMMKLF
jgi:hypothetical protein